MRPSARSAAPASAPRPARPSRRDADRPARRASARLACSASARVRMPPSRSRGSSARKTCAVTVASPSAVCRSGHADAEPGGELIERVAGQIAPCDLAEQPDTQAARTRPGKAARSHSRLSTARSNPTEWPITTASPMKAASSGQISGKAGACGDRRIVDAVDRGGGGRDRHARTHQPPERRVPRRSGLPQGGRRPPRPCGPRPDRARWSRYRARRRRARSTGSRCRPRIPSP